MSKPVRKMQTANAAAQAAVLPKILSESLDQLGKGPQKIRRLYEAGVACDERERALCRSCREAIYAHAWESIWRRFMDRVIEETKVENRFTEHDLRAKCASDATSLEHARALLLRADARTTDAIYQRKPEVVKPLSGIG